MYTTLALLVIGTIVAVVVVITIKSSKDIGRGEVIYINPTLALPSMILSMMDRERLVIKEEIEKCALQRNATFDKIEKNYPRYLALNWILNLDKMQVKSES